MSTRTSIILITVATCAAATSASSTIGSAAVGLSRPNHVLVDKIVVTSDRHAPTLPPQFNNGEIYLINLDGSGEQRLTHNDVFDAGGPLSPDGKKMVFDSNRNRQPGEPINTSDLFLMNADGTEPTFLIRGASPTWSPDGKYIAFHASASGKPPINGDPGAATEDSDIFVVNVDDLLEHGTPPRNLTNDPATVDEDPDWSPDGTSIVYTSHDANQRPVPPARLDYTTAEVFVRNADGTGQTTRLTFNDYEERAPNWSNDGTRISYMCRTGSPRFEICVMDADGDSQRQLTDNEFGDLSTSWSPDDQRIFFQRAMPEPGTPFVRNQLWWVTTAEGTASEQVLVPSTSPTGSTFFPGVGVLRVKAGN